MSDGDHISPWMPEQNRLRLAVLGKLIEECNELSARAARCIIHGFDETDPDTGRTNGAELSREVSDVHACLYILHDELGCGPVDQRVGLKTDGYRRWHSLIENGAQP